MRKEFTVTDTWWHVFKKTSLQLFLLCVVSLYSFGACTLGQELLVRKVSIKASQREIRVLLEELETEVSARPLDANGFRGAILLKAGVYPVSDMITINASGVVQRGEGAEVNQTVIVGTNRNFDAHWSRGLIYVNGNTFSQTEVPGSRRSLTAQLVPTGTTRFIVESCHDSGLRNRALRQLRY